MSIKVKNLRKTFGSQIAVNDLSFSIDKGEVVGFLGPNGAGKSTTMKILTSFLSPDGGAATINGHDVGIDSREVRKMVGYLPENNPLYSNMYLVEFLNFIAKTHALENRKSRVSEMIELTGLQSEYKKKISALSKGNKQRVGLAQAMIHDPDVLILDEPTTGLDPNQLTEIRAVLSAMKERKTVIFSTHIMQEIQAICDRVIIINEGKLVADSPIEELSHKVNNENVIEIVFLDSVRAEDFRKIPLVHKVEQKNQNTIILYTEKSQKVHEQLFAKAIELNTPFLSMNNKTLSVEDVFQRLTNKAQ